MLVEMTQAAPVVYGAGSIREVGRRIMDMGSNVVLCICDGVIKSIGTAEKIENILKEAGLRVVTFDGVKPEAPDVLVDECAKLAREAKVDGIVAIGGGSTIDTAKGVRLLLEKGGSIRDYLVERNKIKSSFRTGRSKGNVPLIAIPTTSGTGSEVTSVGVVMDTERNVKDVFYGCAASLAMLDPELTLSLPPYPTAATGMDAFAHAAESMTSTRSNPKTQVLGLYAINRLVKWLPEAVVNGSNLEARAELLLASNFAGMAMCDGVAHLGHDIAHAVGQEFHIDHGTACAIGLPESIAYVAEAAPETVKQIGLAMGLRFAEDVTPEDLGQVVADAIRNFMRKIGIKSLKDFGCDKDDVVRRISPIVFGNKELTSLCLRLPSDVDIEKIVADSYCKYE